MRPMNLMKLMWWKAFPPAFPSPYLYAPFSRHFKRILTRYASRAWVAVEFGRLNGYSTNIILKALPPGGRLDSYDKNPFCWSGKSKSPYLACYCGEMLETIPTLGHFDFMWIDVAADNPTIEKAYSLLHPRLESAVVITEGHKRRNERVLKPSFPFQELTSSPPGLFRFLP